MRASVPVASSSTPSIQPAIPGPFQSPPIQNVQEVLSNFVAYPLYKMGQDFLDILYLPGDLSVGYGEDENDDADQVAETVPETNIYKWID